ncbi:MAG: hypothetical protein P9X24_05260 [Candidatus Hatepunaea meridiana]|nr:hypothetical protein [Candidatus Hatepunaea meridiana]
MEVLKERDVLINRTQMLGIAREHRIFISKSTIHRWANESNFPLAVGKDGLKLLYERSQFVRYLKRILRKIEEDH